jgi:diguanylate cyclase (GGDEF)-like protein
LLFIDLDHFKEINDSFGHAAGDELLRQLRPRLAGSLRESDVLVRVGGDELAVVTMDTDAAYAADIAGRLMAKLEEPFVLDSVSVRISAAMGIASAPTDVSDSAGLLRCADLAMYRAKSGASPIERYRHDIDDGSNELRLVEELRVAVEDGRFELHFQPQVDLRSGEISGVEALLRWPHPRLGLVAPLDFLPLAEEAGLMPRLTNVVLEHALAECATWHAAGLHLTVSVNMSVSSCAIWGSASRSMTSAPGSRRSRTWAASRSASSSWTARSSQASPPQTWDVIWRWYGRRSSWATRWRCAWSPRGSRIAPLSTSSARWVVTSPRGTSSAGRCSRRTSFSRRLCPWSSRSRRWRAQGSGRALGGGRLRLTALTALLLTACSSVPAQPASPSTQRTQTPAPTATPSAASSPAPLGLAGCAAAQPLASLPILARTDLSPDDLLARPDGSLWVTDPVGGSIEHLAADGLVLARSADGQAPEGMVPVGSSIVLAEQGPNRLVSFTPPAAARTTVLTLPARGGQDGVDGIGIDLGGGRLLIPDSPHGTLLSASPDGSHLTTLASGLGRDVAATIGPDGAIWVAVEGNRGLWRVPAGGGAAVPVGTALAQLDDVVTAGSLLYATLLIAHEVVAVDPATGASRVLVRGIGAPQGLALLAGGRLAVADSTTHVIATLPTCTT